LSPDQLNVDGVAIALGHPFGMTGARISATVLNGLVARDKTVGLETMWLARRGYGNDRRAAQLVRRTTTKLPTPTPRRSR
jgi:acetyl-CoA acetyltransferase